MVKKILQYPHPFLRKPTIPFLPTFLEYKHAAFTIINDMIDTLKENKEGVALAANQIGYGYNIIAVKEGFSPVSSNFIFIDSELTFPEDNEILYEYEGCLSIKPNKKVADLLNFKKGRFDKSTLTTYLVDGTKTEVQLRGFISRMFQHEMDHIFGKLNIDGLNKATRLKIAKGLHT